MTLGEFCVGLVYTLVGLVLLAVNVGLFYMAFLEKPLTAAAAADKFWSRLILTFEVLMYGGMFFAIWKGWI